MNFNERTNTLPYKNISLTLYSRCFFRILGWVGLLNRGSLGPQPSVCKLVFTVEFLPPTNSTAAGTCLYSFITPTHFRLFTQVYLLINGSRVNIQQHHYNYLPCLSFFGNQRPKQRRQNYFDRDCAIKEGAVPALVYPGPNSLFYAFRFKRTRLVVGWLGFMAYQPL